MDSWRRRAEGALLALLLIGLAILPADAQEGWRGELQRTRAGSLQSFSTDVVAPANSGDITVFTGAVAPVNLLLGCQIRANSATTGDLTSAAVYVSGAQNHVQMLISTADAAQANLALEGSVTVITNPGPVYPGEIIEMDLQGTGATPVDLTVFCGGFAMHDGGTLQ